MAPIAAAVDEVEEVVARLLIAPRSRWWKMIRESEYQDVAVARRILTLAVDARLRDPRTSIQLTHSATTILDKLPSDDHVANVRFEAWKFASAILREAGRYAETREACSEAEAAARMTSQPQLALASVLLSRALLSVEPDVWQPKEAADLLEKAERVFIRHRDPRVRAAQTVRGLLLFRAGDLHGARDNFSALVDATSSEDREAYLDALSNLTWVRVELAESDAEVEDAIITLIDENLSRGRTVQVARALWMRGRVNVARGKYDDAVTHLRTARGETSDTDTSLRVGVDTIEALLLASRADEAFQLARELAAAAVALDQAEPSRRRALTSQVLAYLRETAQRQSWTPDLVADLARYMDRITRQRPFDFVPPMPLADM
jgi:tetratricopeptide (TPR) repeat protein